MTDTTAPQAPPFCPNPDCPYHSGTTASWRWVRNGYFSRRGSPRRVQRFRCGHCRRHFSQQTFSTTYWLKRPELLVPIFHRLLGCSGFRQIGREFECSPQTIATHSARLGRHCLLFHERLRPRGELTEPCVLDTFVSFEYSQFHPTGFHLLAGKESHFFHGFADSELRRSGSMTARQKRKRARLEALHGRPDPRSTEKEVAALLEIVLAGSTQVELYTDEHQDYPRALRRLASLSVVHHTTSSRAARTPRNPLFVVNLLDLLIRHGGSNHKRETIGFSKRRQGAAERLWIMLAWRNYVKSFSERKRDATPAMRLGVCDHRWKVPEILAERLFPSRVRLPQRWEKYYWRKVATRMIPRGVEHRRVFAM
jgi:transposase-like protein